MDPLKMTSPVLPVPVVSLLLSWLEHCALLLQRFRVQTSLKPKSFSVFWASLNKETTASMFVFSSTDSIFLLLTCVSSILMNFNIKIVVDKLACAAMNTRPELFKAKVGYI